MPENPPHPPDSSPAPSPEPSPLLHRLPESSSNRLRRLLGLETKPPKPPPGPPLGRVAGAAVKVLGSFFGAGFLPMAPGTWGSLAAFGLWLAGRDLAIRAGISGDLVDIYSFLAAVAFFAATLVLGRPAERAAGSYDPKWFVLDELGGTFLALYGLAGYNHTLSLLLASGAFLLFRVLDATKLGLIGWADRRMTGGLGILMDDLFAGAAANLIVRGAALLLIGQPPDAG